MDILVIPIRCYTENQKYIFWIAASIVTKSLSGQLTVRIVSRPRLKMRGDGAFDVFASKVWNSLLLAIRLKTSLSLIFSRFFSTVLICFLFFFVFCDLICVLSILFCCSCVCHHPACFCAKCFYCEAFCNFIDSSDVDFYGSCWSPTVWKSMLRWEVRIHLINNMLHFMENIHIIKNVAFL